MNEKKRMSFPKAVRVLMGAASRDYIGQGCGIRANTDEHRAIVAEAWAVCFRRLNGREPWTNEWYNAGMTPV